MSELEPKIAAVETALAELTEFVRKQAAALAPAPAPSTTCPVCGSTTVVRRKLDGRVTCNRGHVYRP